MHSLKVAQRIMTTALIAGAMTPATVWASPSSGVTPTNFSTVTLTKDFQSNHDRVKLQTKDPVTVRVQRLDFAAGGYTGFHHHPGVVIVSVASGTVSLVDGEDCSRTDYGPGTANGSIFIEADDHAHQAISSAGATVFVTYLVPDNGGSPVFRVEEPVPFCASSL